MKQCFHFLHITLAHFCVNVHCFWEKPGSFLHHCNVTVRYDRLPFVHCFSCITGCMCAYGSADLADFCVISFCWQALFSIWFVTSQSPSSETSWFHSFCSESELLPFKIYLCTRNCQYCFLFWALLLHIFKFRAHILLVCAPCCQGHVLHHENAKRSSGRMILHLLTAHLVYTCLFIMLHVCTSWPRSGIWSPIHFTLWAWLVNTSVCVCVCELSKCYKQTPEMAHYEACPLFYLPIPLAASNRICRIHASRCCIDVPLKASPYLS